MAAQSNELMLCEVRTSKKLREMSAEIPLEVHGVEFLSFPQASEKTFLKVFVLQSTEASLYLHLTHFLILNNHEGGEVLITKVWSKI